VQRKLLNERMYTKDKQEKIDLEEQRDVNSKLRIEIKMRLCSLV
jgi:hypothetical protein